MSSTALATVEPKRSLIADMAAEYGMDPGAFQATLRATVVPANTSNEEFAAFLLVAKHYKLNPILKEIYAFPKRGGGIQPIVSVDGWANLVNSHPACDGFEFHDALDDKGQLVAVTCKMYRKDRSHPVEATEYMEECVRNTDTWKQWPRRMLRHKALIQAARYAFGFAGIIDPDEAERMPENERAPVVATMTPPPAPPPAPAAIPIQATAQATPTIPPANDAMEIPVFLRRNEAPPMATELDDAPGDDLAELINGYIEGAGSITTLKGLEELDDEVCSTLDTANRDDQRSRWNIFYSARKIELRAKAVGK